MLFQLCIAIFAALQFCGARVVPSVQDANRLATWNDDDKQNIWELGGHFEGDMILSANQRNGLIDVETRWPGGEIPYEIDSVFDLEQQSWIVYSLTELYNKTCIKPRPRTDEDVDYVYITGEPNGCYSQVGRNGGRQELNLQLYKPGTGCLRSGTIIHEFLHALGFYHQQSATERDDYVFIDWPNVQEGKEHNFLKRHENETTSFGEVYDYNSIMHYSAYAFSKNGEKTIITKDPQAEIGQRAELSETDIAKLQKMYGCLA